jgi:cytochrome c biogenesis protein CcmG/thiol:disulfide interchange protein DsbE
LQSTPSSADNPAPRRLSRGGIVALIVVSLAVPISALVLILRTHDSRRVATPGTGADPSAALVAPTKAKIGQIAPDFILAGIDGKPLTLSKLRGRVVVLTFFASWCNPCEQDMPILERAQHDEGNRIAVVGVNYEDFPKDTRDFVRRLGVTFPTLVEDSTDNPVAARYDVHAMPDTVFIDARGVVRDRLFGPTSEHDLQSAIAALVSS